MDAAAAAAAAAVVCGSTEQQTTELRGCTQTVALEALCVQLKLEQCTVHSAMHPTAWHQQPHVAAAAVVRKTQDNVELIEFAKEVACLLKLVRNRSEL